MTEQTMRDDAVLQAIRQGREVVWRNPYALPFARSSALCDLIVRDSDIADAEARLARFAPFLAKAFPETAETNGLIESPLVAVPKIQAALERQSETKFLGRLFLKMDSHLAISGSVKARGGIYEVLKHAEDIALAEGLLTADDSYEAFAAPRLQKALRTYSVQVGSTGNLGMSIGIMSAALGFRAIVHMSADAKAWKKELLRRRGVEVIEYAGDYSAAVAEGRRVSDADPKSHFVDDEKSVTLFLGYAVAANRLKAQLAAEGIAVDREHPLIVHIPAGVGGAPGGISYGLKRLFKDDVHCFFIEPTQCPSVLLGIATQRFEQANVRDYGLTGKTEADGLACASPSGFVTRIMTPLLGGVCTVSDARLYDYLRLLHESEGIEIEPSACASFQSPASFYKSAVFAAYCKEHGLTEERLANSAHIAWATGGSMVPEHIREQYRNTHLA